MRLSMLLGAAWVGRGFLVSGRPQIAPQEESELMPITLPNLNSEITTQQDANSNLASALLANAAIQPKTYLSSSSQYPSIVFSQDDNTRPVIPGSSNAVGSNVFPTISSSDAPDRSPENGFFVSTVPYGSVSHEDENSGLLRIADAPPMTADDYPVPEDVQATFSGLINSRYCIYELSPDRKHLLFQQCIESSYWGDFVLACEDSKAGFALYRLVDGRILSIMNLYHECKTKDSMGKWTHTAGCRTGDDTRILKRFQQTWVNSVRKVLKGRTIISIGPIKKQAELLNIAAEYVEYLPYDPGNHYYIPTVEAGAEESGIEE
ncbi:hypothetical protein MMC07_005018 [Pseudocyphellaria aurata]|nr:hypothetical protein [Pseudocyphellaria aurata]